MRILKNNIKVYGFNELSKNAQIKALKIKLRHGVNDYEFYSSGEVFPYTNDINYY